MQASVNAQSNFSLVPSEILEHHILYWLSLPSLIACSLTGSRPMHKTAIRVIDSARKKLRLSFSTIVLKLLFAEGHPVQLAEWFQQQLRFPVFSSGYSTM